MYVFDYLRYGNVKPEKKLHFKNVKCFHIIKCAKLDETIAGIESLFLQVNDSRILTACKRRTL